VARSKKARAKRGVLPCSERVRSLNELSKIAREADAPALFPE